MPRDDQRPGPRESAKAASWGLAFWAGAQLAAAVFSRNATAAVAVQAALAEWGAGRAGVTWSDPLAPLPSWKEIGARAGRGAALGLTAAALVAVAAVASRRASLASGSRASGALLVLGLVVSLLGAVRDELLLRGVVLRVVAGEGPRDGSGTSGRMPALAALAACGAAAAAASFGVEGTVGVALVAEALRGSALAALWLKDRGAWMAVAANAAWTWTLGSALQGGVLDLRFAGPGGGALEAWTTLVVLLACAVGALAWAGSGRGGDSSFRRRLSLR